MAAYLHHGIYPAVVLIVLVEAKAFEESCLRLTLSQGRSRGNHKCGRLSAADEGWQESKRVSARAWTGLYNEECCERKLREADSVVK